MASLAEIARKTNTLTPEQAAHLQRLVGSWQMLSDLSFADLLLLIPDDNEFVVAGQARPTTNQTCHPEDLTGVIWPQATSALVQRTWTSGQICDGESSFRDGAEQSRVRCFPVRHRHQLIAVLLREAPVILSRQPGELERIYVDTANILGEMVSAGEFPFASDALGGEESPRVGDGTLVFDADGHIQFASPNAMNALHRMGVSANVINETFESLGIDDHIIGLVIANRLPATEELSPIENVVVRLHCLPLITGGVVVGLLGLLRDISDVRRLDQLLLSKDAAIREVHHRVKNNLQTISALLRLQSRRMSSADGRLALDEAERRIRSIALVHEFLSRDPSDQVPFGQILDALMRMADEGNTTPELTIQFSKRGDPGELDAEVATPLAVVLTELLQNAVEHAFPSRIASPDGTEGTFVGKVDVEIHNTGERLIAEVRDNGAGLPPGFEIGRTDSLGLSIVRDLIRTQLGGNIELYNVTRDQSRPEVIDGTVVRIDIPLTESPTRFTTIR